MLPELRVLPLDDPLKRVGDDGNQQVEHDDHDQHDEDDEESGEAVSAGLSKCLLIPTPPEQLPNIGNNELRLGSEKMAQASGLGDLSRCYDIAAESLTLDDSSVIEHYFQGAKPRLKAVMLLTKAMVSSPSNVTPLVVKAVRDALEPTEVMELVTWLSLLSLLHRLQVLHEARAQA